MPIYQIDGLTPVVEESYVHPTAVLIGDVILGKGSMLGPTPACAAILAASWSKTAPIFRITASCTASRPGYGGEDGHIGHGAILHGCVIGRNALVGMSAVIIDGAVIGENSIVGASAFVKANAEMPANHLIIGSPAKAIRTLSEQELAWKNRVPVNTRLVERCKQTLHQVEPLREVEAGRATGV
jgi:phenylacetic acid degradation protein